MKVCVYIGRFQPFHAGHLSVLRAALAQHDRVLVVIGSAQTDRDREKNPFDAFERMYMIAGSLTKPEVERTRFIYQNDCPGENDRWVEHLERIVNKSARILAKREEAEPEIFLTGSRKDESSFYIDLLPWKFVPAPPHGAINATDIRRSFFSHTLQGIVGGQYDYCWTEHLTPATIKVMKAHVLQEEAERLLSEVEEIIPIDAWKLRHI